MGGPTITNLVGLLNLPADVQDTVRIGQISLGHAKVLKGLSDPVRQMAASKEIITRGMSVHATEAYVKQLQAEGKVRQPKEKRQLAEHQAAEPRQRRRLMCRRGGRAAAEAGVEGGNQGQG